MFGRFGASDGELAEAIIRFWSGDPIRVADLRRRLREAGEARFALSAVPARELARQRLRFAARLFTAAGYAGWVVLFDEVELIGRYSVLQRGRSYAELARWVRRDETDPGVPLVAVLAMTDDFEAAVVSGKNDRTVVPAKLRARQTHESDEIAARAEVGMQIIDREMLLLAPPDAGELDRAYSRLKELHSEAFGWDPPRWPGWSAWPPRGCASTCEPGSTNGTWSGSTRSSRPRPRWWRRRSRLLSPTRRTPTSRTTSPRMSPPTDDRSEGQSTEQVRFQLSYIPVARRR